MTRLHFGRTALPRTSIQLSLGRLECKGRHTNRSGNGDYKMPSNCDQLRSLGHRSSGFYLTKNNPSSSAVGENRSRIQTTYCDFTKTSGTKGININVDMDQSNIYKIDLLQDMKLLLDSTTSKQQTESTFTWGGTRITIPITR